MSHPSSEEEVRTIKKGSALLPAGWGGCLTQASPLGRHLPRGLTDEVSESADLGGLGPGES